MSVLLVQKYRQLYGSALHRAIIGFRADRQDELRFSLKDIVFGTDTAASLRTTESALPGLHTPTALSEAVAAVDRAEARSDNMTLLVGLCRLGELHLERGEAHAARAALLRAHTVSRTVGDLRTEIDVLDSLGRSAFAIGFVEESLEYFRSEQALAADIDDQEAYAIATANEGVVLAKAQAYEAAMPTLLEAIRVLTDRPQDRAVVEQLATSYSFLAHVYAELKHYEPASTNLQTALIYSRSAGDWSLEARLLRYLGRVMEEQHRWLDAAYYFNQSLATLRFYGADDELVRATARDLADCAVHIS